MPWMRYKEDYSFDDSTWDAIVSYMDYEKREEVHIELAPCSNLEFINRYIELDPEFEQLLAEEFGIEWF